MSRSAHHVSHHHSRSSKSARNATSLIFGFFLALVLVVEFLLIIVNAGFFWEKGFLSVLDKNYYQYCLDYVNEQSKYYTMPTGYDPSVLDGVFTTEDIRADVHNYVTCAFEGDTYDPDMTELRERLTTNVKKLYTSDGFTLTEQDDEVIKTYVDEVMKIYRKGTKMPGLEKMASVRNRLVKIVLIASVILGVLALVLVVAIVRSHHFVHRGLRYVAYATGGACLLLFVAPCIVYVTGTYKSLSVTPRYFYHFCVSMIERLIYMCFASSACLLLVTIALIMLIASKRKEVIRSHSHAW